MAQIPSCTAVFVQDTALVKCPCSWFQPVCYFKCAVIWLLWLCTYFSTLLTYCALIQSKDQLQSSVANLHGQLPSYCSNCLICGNSWNNTADFHCKVGSTLICQKLKADLVICKCLLESLFLQKEKRYILWIWFDKDEKVIRKSQYGYTKGKSSLIRLTAFYNEMTGCVNEGRVVGVK